MAKGAYIGIPDIYKEVEYIESSGTQYIDTGFIPNQDTRIVCKLSLEIDGTTQWGFGARTAVGQNAYGFYASANRYYSSFYNATDLIQPSSLNTKNPVVVDINKNVVTIDGANKLTATAATFTPNVSIYLFGCNTNGARTTGDPTIYYCQIYDNGTLVRDYVPVINSNGTPGLFDKVSKQFYANKGTGNFTAGAETGNTYSAASIARKIKKGYVGIKNFKKRNLPIDYTQIEYIESTGTQYIDTEFKHNQDTRVVMDVQLTTVPTSSNIWLFEGRSGTGSNVGSKGIFYYATSTGRFTTDFSSSPHSRIDFAGISGSDRLFIDYNKNVCTINGNTVIHPETTFQGTYNLYLLADNRAGSVQGRASAKLYSCKIYDNGLIVRDYIPVINNKGIAGLYDVVNKVFYENKGTGAFIAGPIYSNIAYKIKKAYIGIGGGATYREVEYIQSSGTQYIDTGFMPNNNTRVIMDAELPTTPTGTEALFGARTDAAVDAYALLWSSSVAAWRSYYNTQYTGTSVWASVAATGRRVYDKNKETTVIAGISQSYTNAAFTCKHNLLLLALNLAGTAGWFATAKLYACQIYDNGILIRDYVPVINSNSTPGLFDKVSKKFYANKGSGNFTAGAETGATYISMGVARPCWSGGELTYYGTATALSTARYGHAATTVGNYALFGGGVYEDSDEGYTCAATTVNAYSDSLTHSIAGYSSGLIGMYVEAATVGNYAIFHGGRDDVYNTVTAEVAIFDASLTRHYYDGTLGYPRIRHAAATVGNYALFAGGTEYDKKVDAWDTSLTLSFPTDLSVSMYDHCGVSIGNYALFGGRPYTTVNAYNESLTRSTPTSLSSTIEEGAATTVGNYALIAGNVVNAYDQSLTRSIPTALSKSRTRLSATSIDGYAIFGGGYINDAVDTVDIYDASLTRTVGTGLSSIRYYLAATTVGNYALFGGGRDRYNYTANVDVYTVV